MRSIAIYGGSFNPPHLGHLALIDAALSRCGEVVVVPAAQSPFKTPYGVGGGARVDMLRLLTGGRGGVSVSDFEIAQGGASFTENTISHFLRLAPDAQIFLVIGSDQLLDLAKWRNFDLWKKQVVFLIAERQGHDGGVVNVAQLDIAAEKLAVPVSSISSTQVRDLVAKGLPIQRLTGEAVAGYILSAGLYRTNC